MVPVLVAEAGREVSGKSPGKRFYRRDAENAEAFVLLHSSKLGVFGDWAVNPLSSAYPMTQ
jgi:hypothetical protein